MIFIDATEGLSGDMLLAAMLGLLDDDERERTVERIAAAAHGHGLEFHLAPVTEGDVPGLGISYRDLEPASDHEASYEASFSLLAEMEQRMGSGAPGARAILRTIFEAEGKAHGLPPEEVHLHEIGRPQAVLNIAAIGELSRRLVEMTGGPFVGSTITTGRGIVVVSHGAVRVPPPASEALLKDMMHQPGDAPGERATPTGIAAVKVLVDHQSETIPGSFNRKSVGFGTKRFAGRLGRTTLLLT